MISQYNYSALERPSLEDEKQGDDNAQTIRPTRSPAALPIPLARAPSVDIGPIVEDYSDLGTEEDDERIQEKVANFKVSPRCQNLCIISKYGTR
jgi:hypothetical protein